MMSVKRSLFLALPLAVVLSACGSGPVVLSEEEKAARITINPFEDALTPDPELAASAIALPPAAWQDSARQTCSTCRPGGRVRK